MITCINCKSSDWDLLHRSAIDPAEDTFKCKLCGHTFKRYDVMKNNWEVLVGNVGTVYSGTNGFQALKDYNAYVAMSKTSLGRALVNL